MGLRSAMCCLSPAIKRHVAMNHFATRPVSTCRKKLCFLLYAFTKDDLPIISYFVAVKKLSFVFLATCLALLSYAQPNWQQQIAYTIDVSLNEKEKSLDAFEKLVYANNSPDTLRFLWFHLWPNAYKNDRTAFSDQLLDNGNTAFYFENKEERGYINRLSFTVD